MPLVESRVLRQRSPGACLREDDAALVVRVQAGDERAFAAIFKCHHASLLAYCRHLLGSRDEGEDALQQAFIKAHQALLGGTAPRELRPWLYAIARNCCLSAIAARRPTAPLDDHTPTLAGLSDEVRQREDLRGLLAAIGRLPEDQRSALLLAELDDLSHHAIAQIVGCPVSKVKALIYQARSALIADRDARETPCQDIREQLSVARGGELRRGPLRRHLRLCAACRDFQLAVNAQRQSLAALLPVLPSAGLAAAVLGHTCAHAVGAAGMGGAAPVGGAAGTGVSAAPAAGAAGTGIGAAPAAGAGGMGVGVTTTGATAAGGSGIAASGTAAAGTAVGAGAATGAGTSVGTLVGGGLIAKLAVGGAVVALAAAGAVAVRPRLARAISAPRPATSSRRVASKRLDAFARRGNDAAGALGANAGRPDGARGAESPLALTAAANSASVPEPDPSMGSTSNGDAQSLLTLIAAGSSSPLSSGIPGAPAVTAAASSGRDGSSAAGLEVCAELPCATLAPRARRLREARGLSEARRLREARGLSEARRLREVRRLRKAHRRARRRRARRRAQLRKALRKTPRPRRRPAVPAPPKPSKPTAPIVPAPSPIHRRRARPTSSAASSPTASTTAGSTKATSTAAKGTDPEANTNTACGNRKAGSATSAEAAGSTTCSRKAGTGAGGRTSGTTSGGAGSGAEGPVTKKAGAGAGKSSSGAGGKEGGSGTAGEEGGSAAGAKEAGSGAGGKEAGSGAHAGKTKSETGTGSASTSGAGHATESAETAGRASEAIGAAAAGATSHRGPAPQPQKQFLVEEIQLPNL
jgi:RNA polymerase sigma factor (sigma-70 family)